MTLLRVLDYRLACDGKTLACARITDYYVEPAKLRTKGYLLPDPIHRARLDEAHAELKRRYEAWNSVWWRRAFTREPRFIDVWREMGYEDAC